MTFLLIFFTAFSFAQQLTYKGGGEVYNGNTKLSKSEVRALLGNQRELLNCYNHARTKKRVGNITLYSGLGIGFIGFAAGYAGDSNIANPASIGGAVLAIVAIPIKSGYSNKVKKAVDGYNARKTVSAFAISDLSICSSQNGVGLKIIF